MNNPRKIAVVGNCQARPVHDILRAMAPELVSTGAVVVHLAKEEDAAEHYEALDQADYIFAQLVQRTYKPAHITTEALRARFGDRVISWPNLFFSGQCPNLVYVTASAGRRVVGPLREYQFLPLFEAFQAGLTVPEALARLRTGDATDYETIARASLAELVVREKAADVKISDLVSGNWRERRLFFSFNHPVSWLLIRLCERLLEKAGIEQTTQVTAELIGEPLDLIIPPNLATERRSLGFEFDTSDSARGGQMKTGTGKVELSVRRIYSLESLAEATFEALSLQKHLLKDVRITPARV